MSWSNIPRVDGLAARRVDGRVASGETEIELQRMKDAIDTTFPVRLSNLALTIEVEALGGVDESSVLRLAMELIGKRVHSAGVDSVDNIEPIDLLTFERQVHRATDLRKFGPSAYKTDLDRAWGLVAHVDPEVLAARALARHSKDVGELRLRLRTVGVPCRSRALLHDLLTRSFVRIGFGGTIEVLEFDGPYAFNVAAFEHHCARQNWTSDHAIVYAALSGTRSWTELIEELVWSGWMDADEGHVRTILGQLGWGETNGWIIPTTGGALALKVAAQYFIARPRVRRYDHAKKRFANAMIGLSPLLVGPFILAPLWVNCPERRPAPPPSEWDVILCALARQDGASAARVAALMPHLPPKALKRMLMDLGYHERCVDPSLPDHPPLRLNGPVPRKRWIAAQREVDVYLSSGDSGARVAKQKSDTKVVAVLHGLFLRYWVKPNLAELVACSALKMTVGEIRAALHPLRASLEGVLKYGGSVVSQGHIQVPSRVPDPHGNSYRTQLRQDSLRARLLDEAAWCCMQAALTEPLTLIRDQLHPVGWVDPLRGAQVERGCPPGQATEAPPAMSPSPPPAAAPAPHPTPTPTPPAEPPTRKAPGSLEDRIKAVKDAIISSPPGWVGRDRILDVTGWSPMAVIQTIATMKERRLLDHRMAPSGEQYKVRT